jgi:hypothetical protein
MNQEDNSPYNPNLGYLAFGGIAPVATTNTAVTVPVQPLAVTSQSSEYIYYSIDIDSYIFDGSTALTGSGKQAILDTGTTLNYLPTPLVEAYNSQFVPPATHDGNWYFVDCNATVPEFAVEIGGTKFSINAADNIMPVGADANGTIICASGVQDGGDPSNPDRIYIMCVLQCWEANSYFTWENDTGEMFSFTMS